MPHSRVPISSSSREKSACATVFQVCLRLALLYNTPSEMLEQRRRFLPPRTAEINEVGIPAYFLFLLSMIPRDSKLLEAFLPCRIWPLRRKKQSRMGKVGLKCCQYQRIFVVSRCPVTCLHWIGMESLHHIDKMYSWKFLAFSGCGW